MKVKREYTKVGEGLRRLSALALKEKELDIAEVLVLVHAIYSLELEKDLMDFIKEFTDANEGIDKYDF